MEDLEEKLHAVLSDPEQMQKIMDLAGTLSMTLPQQEQKQLAVPPEAVQAAPASQSAERNRQALLAALRPFLRPERQKKLDQAMQLSKLSALAELALQSLGGTEGRKEAPHV